MENTPLIYCGRGTHKLAKAVVEQLGVELADLDMEEFADSEPWFRIPNYKEVSDRNVFVIQSTSEYAPKTYFDLFGIMNAIKRQTPRKLVVIMPFMGFRRQERDKDGGEAVMAELMARFIIAAGATHVVLCDPHAPELVKFFSSIQVRVLDPNPIFRDALNNIDPANYVVLTPDLGREDTAIHFATLLGIRLVESTKDRTGHDESELTGIQGDVSGKRVIIREDEIDTGGTIFHTVREVKKLDARDVIVMATHGVLAGGAVQKIKRNKDISKIYITDSVYLPWEKRIEKIEVLTIAPLIAEVIREIDAE